VVRRLLKSAIRSCGNLLLQPDPQILWLPAAVREGKRLLREEPHAAIVATGPPFSTFLVGDALSRFSGLPLVLDYRDEWGINHAYSENRGQGPLGRCIQQRMQNRVVCSARSLVATTRSSARALEQVCRSAGSSAEVTWIANGFDPDDFRDDPHPRPRRAGTYRLAYVGTLWNLTSVAPLVNAVCRLASERPDLAHRLELVFAGRRTASQQQILDVLQGLPCRVVEHSYVDHEDAIDILRDADGLCVLLSDCAGAERVLPAKIFEYLASRRPILAITPPGELADLLRDYPAARQFHPEDRAGIAHALAEAIQRGRERRPISPLSWNLDRYNRRNQAGQLAELLNSLTPPPHLERRAPRPTSNPKVLVPC
jgi:glycosyltransferase involved in cell wall biosynthesis